MLKVLSENWVRVDFPAILQMLEWKLGLKSQDRVIRFPPEVVEEAVKSAPKTIDVYDRPGERILQLGEDRLRFWVGGHGVVLLSKPRGMKPSIFSSAKTSETWCASVHRSNTMMSSPPSALCAM